MFKKSTNTFARRPVVRGYKPGQNQTKDDTSWNQVGDWYASQVGEKGLFFHQTVILPVVKQWLRFGPGESVLDLGCGSGVLERQVPADVEYLGIDLSKKLISEAESRKKVRSHNFRVHNMTRPLDKKQLFSQAVMILSLQNVEAPDQAIQVAAEQLQPGGALIMVLNHPCFRIPRQSSWGVEEAKQLQYRRVDRYSTTLKIPVQMHPGQKNSPTTWSFHWSLDALFGWLREAGFLVSELKELHSPKNSQGTAARMENRAREEFPLFLAIKAIKNG
jgi:SAM-dependent methyltransferase